MASTPHPLAQIAEALYGVEDCEIKTRVTQTAQDAARRRARQLGYRSMSEFVRDAIHIATWGPDAVEQCHAGRLRGMGQPWDEGGPDSVFGSGL